MTLAGLPEYSSIVIVLARPNVGPNLNLPRDFVLQPVGVLEDWDCVTTMRSQQLGILCQFDFRSGYPSPVWRTTDMESRDVQC